MRRKEKEGGSAAIEAVICLTVFTVAIMTILSFINICRAQAAVSHAVDAAAKEMSQYAYFYHLCGLDEFQQKNIDKVKEERKDLSQIVGGTEAIFKVFGTLSSDEVTSDDIVDLVDGTVETVTKDAEEKKKEAGKKTEITMANAAGKIEEMISAVSSIKNPIEFLKSMVTIGAQEGASFLRSQLIAVPFATLLVRKHFEAGSMDADTYLQTLHIEGMDALNFKLSTIFAPASPNDIHLVCYYEVKPAQFFNFDFGTVVLCKESVTRAWLGGDIVYTYKAEDGKKSETGIWDMASLQYGKYIVNEEKQALLAQNCYDVSGTGADAFRAEQNTLIHIRSMDIYSPSYQDQNAVKNTLRQEYSKLASASDRAKDTVRIKEAGEWKEIASPQDTRKLHMIIVIPEGERTETFKEGLKAALDELVADGSFSYEVKQGYGTSPNNRDKKDDVSEEGGES